MQIGSVQGSIFRQAYGDRAAGQLQPGQSAGHADKQQPAVRHVFETAAGINSAAIKIRRV